jgi:hypothetical protein
MIMLLESFTLALRKEKIWYSTISINSSGCVTWPGEKPEISAKKYIRFHSIHLSGLCEVCISQLAEGHHMHHMPRRCYLDPGPALIKPT